MAILEKKVTAQQLSAYGVVSQPDVLTGTPQSNKQVFDRLVGEVVASCLNPVIDELASTAGAGNIGAAVEGIAGNTAQLALSALKTMVDNRYTKAESDALLGAGTNSLLRDVALDQNGVWTFTRKDGTTVVYDTKLEKIAVNFTLEGDFLVLHHDDGTTDRVSLAAFRDHHRFADSDTVAWSFTGDENNRTFTASIRPNSVTLSMLALDAVGKIEADVAASGQNAAQAQASATAAAESARTAGTKAAEAAAGAADALASKTAAKTSETNAKASETGAAGSAATAAQKAAEASASAALAGQKATEASGSADAAKTSETNAKASETTAAQKAGEIAGAARTAATKAAEAAASADAAARSQEMAKVSEDAAVSNASQAKLSASDAAGSASTAQAAATAATSEADRAKSEADRAQGIVGGDYATRAELAAHTGNLENPHGVTAAQVGARPDTWAPTAADVGADAAGSAAAVQGNLNAHAADKTIHVSDETMRNLATKAQVQQGDAAGLQSAKDYVDPYLTFLEDHFWGEQEFVKLIDRTTALTELPPSLTSIGDSAFRGCTSLALTALPAGITSIGYSAFYGCTNLALTALPAGITSIGNYAFEGCTGLALTTLSAGLTSIGGSAFRGCTNLALTALPAGLTSIGGFAFGGCTGITTLSIGSKIQTIDSDAFEGCTNLTRITINRAENAVADAPWGAYNATIEWTGTT